MQTLNVNAAAFKTIGETVRRHESLGESIKADRAMIKTEKLDIYGVAAAEIWNVPLTKGNLPKYAKDAFKDALKNDAGLEPNKGAGKRLYEGSVGISRLRKSLGVPTQATPSAIVDALRAKGINSEADLHKHLRGDKDDEFSAVVAKWVGRLTYRKDENGKRTPNGWKWGKGYDQLEELIRAIDEAEILGKKIGAEAEKAEDERRAVADLLADD